MVYKCLLILLFLFAALLSGLPWLDVDISVDSLDFKYPECYSAYQRCLCVSSTYF